MWQVTHEMLHVTHHTSHITHDTWWWVNILSKFQIPSSYGLGLMMFWRFGGKGWLNQWTNEWISDKGVCRTAPATPGLLISLEGPLQPWKLKEIHIYVNLLFKKNKECGEFIFSKFFWTYSIIKVFETCRESLIRSCSNFRLSELVTLLHR